MPGASPRGLLAADAFVQITDIGRHIDVAKINAIADNLDAIEAARQQQHLSKAEIGRRIDRKPSAVSRLLSGNEQNPTWDTLVDLAYAVDLVLDLKVKKAPKRRATTARASQGPAGRVANTLVEKRLGTLVSNGEVTYQPAYRLTLRCRRSA